MPSRDHEMDHILRLIIEKGIPREKLVANEVPDSPKAEYVRMEDTRPHSSAQGNTSTSTPGTFTALLCAIEVNVFGLLQRIRKISQEESRVSGVTCEEIDDLRAKTSRLEETVAAVHEQWSRPPITQVFTRRRAAVAAVPSSPRSDEQLRPPSTPRHSSPSPSVD
ncbi:hypothetical protein FRX31_033153 [Thalictrum thalictroides]|uniref:Uncharacterized protein n=1 Tax=Thalictrum thalictroides TaxID=46969 RepID=A0A7J6UXF9_THATH|nr:hypothetical protein FRX31_033153 [Thalictrum thalictroides]